MSGSTTVPPALNRIPPFPAVAAKLLALLSNPIAEVHEVAELIASDPMLSGQVLKAVNSYEYALRSPITNIQQAVLLVGLDKIRRIATTAATGSYVKKQMTDELMRCWHHSVATAVLSDEIAQVSNGFASAAFVAGILHDLGRLGLLVAYPDEYRRLMSDAERTSLDLLELENQKFGMDHAEVGRTLAQAWALPDEFLVIMGRHHDPCHGTELDLLRIVHVACRLADSLGFAAIARQYPAASVLLTELPPAVSARIKKTPEQLCQLIEERISTVT